MLAENEAREGAGRGSLAMGIGMPAGSDIPVPRCRPATGKPFAVLTDREGIGDVLIKMPFLRWIERAYPGHPIWWIASYQTAMQGLMRPYAGSEVVEVIAGTKSLDRPGVAWSKLATLPPFTFVFDTRSRGLSVWIARRALKYERYFSALPFYLLSDARPPGRFHRPVLRWRRFLTLAEQAIGARLDPVGTISCSPDALAAAAEMLPSGPRYVGIAPGSRDARKNWPLDRFLELAARLANDGVRPVLLIGPYEEKILAGCPDLPRCGVLKLSEFARVPMVGQIDAALAICKRLSAVVANDAGMGHIAGAMGVPVVSLFGPTAANKMAPFCPDGIVVQARDYGRRAIDAIPVSPVYEAVLRLLARRPTRDGSGLLRAPD
jgi:ADP-heptose:LPS heptosyltransferase